METKTAIATRQCAADYSVVYPRVIRMDDNSSYEPKINHRGYPSISFRRRKLGIDQKVEVHRIIGYQKYGDLIFDERLVLRHLDGDKGNFRQENIAIGTDLDNHLDKPQAMRSAQANILSQFSASRRAFSGDKVRQILCDRRAGLSYAKLAKKYESHKSCIWLIVNGKTYGELTSRGAGLHC